MGFARFDPEKLEIVHTFEPKDTKWDLMVAEVHTYDEGQPKIHLVRQEKYKGKRYRKLGKMKKSELKQIIPLLIECYEWLIEYEKEHGDFDD